MCLPASLKEPQKSLLLAALVYSSATAIYFAFADWRIITDHTRFNHFALLAQSWLDGHLSLVGVPPSYAGNNDFAFFEGRWWVVFPPLPALLLLPLVAWAGSAEAVCDGQFFIWLAGLGPGVLFLALERLREVGFGCTRVKNLFLALLFALGTVYFFTAVQGTVWYAAHVVAVLMASLYLWFSVGAAHPILAGLAMALGFATRAPLLMAWPFFVAEALRSALKGEVQNQARAHPEDTSLRGWRQVLVKVQLLWKRLDGRQFARSIALFGLPVGAMMSLMLWYNWARFGAPSEFGYRYLAIAWQTRIQEWGLFHYHFLARNLGVVLTSLPYVGAVHGQAWFQINAHGLALWVTSPFYVWLLWPRQSSPLLVPLWLTVAAIALPSLFYQNTGWVQFGYRFSNDYAVFLFALLAVGGRTWKFMFTGGAVWALLVNAFGAATFGRNEHADFYFVDSTQRVIYQPD